MAVFDFMRKHCDGIQFVCGSVLLVPSLPIDNLYQSVSCHIILLSLSFCLSIRHATQMRFEIGNLILSRYVLFENTNCILMNLNFHFNLLTFAGTIQQIENEMGNSECVAPQLVCTVDGQTRSVRVHSSHTWLLGSVPNIF